MKMRIHATKRKAISPVLATVILIAITLIAAIAVAGFVFGLFGSFTSTAQLSASVVSCTHAGTATITCVLSVTNSGTGNTNALGAAGSATLKYADTTLGATTASELTLNAANANIAVNAGATVQLTYVFTQPTGAGGPVVGGQASGSFAASNGGSILFSGSVQ